MSVVWFTCNECQFNLDCFGFTQYIRFINEFIFTWYNTNFWRYHISASLNKIVLYPWSGYNVILWQITVHSVMDTTGIADAKIPMWHISICSLNTLTFSYLPIAKKYIVVKHFCQSNVQSITLSILPPRIYYLKNGLFSTRGVCKWC